MWNTTGDHSWTNSVSSFYIYIYIYIYKSRKLAPELCADDTNSLISNSNIENLLETINDELREVRTSFKANKLSLNTSKTKYFLLHSTRKRKVTLNILPPLHIDNVLIKREFFTKFLGIYFDGNISWKRHIDIVSTKICKSIGGRYRTEYTAICCIKYTMNCNILNKFLRKSFFFLL